MVAFERRRNGTLVKSAGVMGGNWCQFCQRKIKMGAVDEHRCYRTIISLSVDRLQLKRVDELATKAGMSRSEFMMAAALAATEKTADEQRLLEIVRAMATGSGQARSQRAKR